MEGRPPGPTRLPEDPVEALQLRDEDLVAPRLVEQATDDAVSGVRGRTSSLFSLPLICLGLAVFATCLLVPAVDQNRRLAYEREQLRRDLAQLDEQIAVNDEFLRRLADDPTLAERLVRRQFNARREGTRQIDLPGEGEDDPAAVSSPFALLQVAPPPPLPPYQPVAGRLGELCREPRTRLYLLGGSLFCVVTGLLLGGGRGRD